MPGSDSPPIGLPPTGAVTPEQASGGYPTNPDGSFNPAGSATTDPGGAVTTDVYGLTKAEQQWVFFNGMTPGQNYHGSNQGRKNAEQQADTHGLPVGGETNWQSAEEILKGFSSLAYSQPQMWANTQRQLLAMGAYGNSANSDLYRPGTWSQNDASALIWAMRSYQQQGGSNGDGMPITFSEWLDRNSGIAGANGYGNVGGNGLGGNGPAPLQVSLTDPAALRSYVQQAAMQSLDRGLSEDELNKFVSSFQSQERSAQETQYNNQVAGQSGTTTTPNATADAEQFVEQEHPDEFRQHNVAAYSNALLNLFLPSGSQLAQFQPNASVSGG